MPRQLNHATRRAISTLKQATQLGALKILLKLVRVRWWALRVLRSIVHPVLSDTTDWTAFPPRFLGSLRYGVAQVDSGHSTLFSKYPRVISIPVPSPVLLLPATCSSSRASVPSPVSGSGLWRTYSNVGKDTPRSRYEAHAVAMGR